MKKVIVIALCLVSALGVGQIALLNDSIVGRGLSLQSGETVTIGIESIPANALLHDNTGAALLNDATGATLLNDNP